MSGYGTDQRLRVRAEAGVDEKNDSLIRRRLACHGCGTRHKVLEVMDLLCYGSFTSVFGKVGCCAAHGMDRKVLQLSCTS